MLRGISGQRYLWRGASSFGLLYLIAVGREGEAVARMQTLAGMGFSLVRVLATARHLFDLPATTGRAHLDRLLSLAKSAGLYVEIVALADTDGWSRGELDTQLRSIYAIATGHDNALVEGGNEIGPEHPTQADDIAEACRTFQRSGLALYCPGSVHGGTLCKDRAALTEAQWERGQSKDEWPYWDEVHTYSKDFGTSHLKRGGADGDRGRRVRELELCSSQAHCLFVDDEPIGADETSQPSKRSSDPGVFFLQGVLSRIFETGSTFHSQAGLTSAPFGPVQQACAEAFIRGTAIVPDTTRLAFKNTGWHDSPVKEFTGAIRVYSGLGAEHIACVIAPEPHFTIECQNGYRVVGTRAEMSGCRVLDLAT